MPHRIARHCNSMSALDEFPLLVGHPESNLAGA
jgi:hypothetical protein